jgi:hypothetical protein
MGRVLCSRAAEVVSNALWHEFKEPRHWVPTGPGGGQNERKNKQKICFLYLSAPKLCRKSRKGSVKC